MKATHLRHMGDDLDVVNNARVSFAKTSDWEDGTWSYGTLNERDTKLIHYLNKHKHWAPFANGTNITFHIKAPIPIMRQMFKHKVGSVESEISRRYVSDEPEFFYPEWRHAAENVKQGSGGPHEMLGPETFCGFLGETFRPDLTREYRSYLEDGKALYGIMVESGVCPEQARFLLPQATYSEAIITHSLYGWANLYNLRTDSHSQVEVQQLAHEIGQQIEPLFPVSWKALTGPLD